MHLAILSPIAWRTPPTHYGPWERVVSLLVEGLVQRGIDVTLFATADSETNARLHAIVPRPYEEDKGLDPKVWECLHVSELFERAEEFDLIHNHYDFVPLTYAGLVSTPVLTTIHGFSSPKILPVYKKYNERTYYVSISNADRSPELDYVATVYHGIDLENFTFNGKPNENLLFFGRIHPDKGTRQAIEIARLAGMNLIIAGIVQDRHYFETEVEPHIDGVHIRYVGSADPLLRDKLLGEASALLHPIDFNEPFGLSVVEANACGTPVVAFKRGSMPELVIDGVNGFLVSDVAGAVEAIRRIGTLSRKACREAAERRFSRDRMVDEYLKVYSEILSKAQREDHRPWGYYEVLSDREDHKVKRIVVFPGKRLSLQQHSHRSEHWMIVKGEAVVTRGSEAIELKPGQAIDIPKGTPHRVLNVREEPLIFIEIQTGEDFDENDIERLEDDFGRV
jgi:glycosyltransferase involved in cell wall biosynthesis/quercetin dioxygenase-like cupin family protein